MSALGVLQLLALAALFLTAAGALGSALAYPRLRSRLAAAAPETRARLLTAWAVAPLGLGLLLAVLCLAPGAAGILWPELDHCPDDLHGHHAHLCLVHPPVASGTALGWLLVIAAVGAVAVVWTRILREALAARALLGNLSAHAARDPALNVLVVETDRPFAVATRSDALISRPLVEGLPSEELAAVVAHERAHLERRDALRKLVVRLAAVAHVPSVRRALLADLDLAVEQACDERAALRVGRLEVARALIAVERLMQRRASLPALAFAGSNLVARVEALLAPRKIPRALSHDAALFVVALLLLLPTSHPLHHAIEQVVGFLG